MTALERDDDALDKASPTLMAHQLILAALGEVNFREIAENLLSELED